MSNSDRPQSGEKGRATPPGPDPKAVREGEAATINEEHPGGFKNDPNDPTNPNEVIERSRRKLRQ
jgi:hypothetical protein